MSLVDFYRCGWIHSRIYKRTCPNDKWVQCWPGYMKSDAELFYSTSNIKNISTDGTSWWGLCKLFAIVPVPQKDNLEYFLITVTSVCCFGKVLVCFILTSCDPTGNSSGGREAGRSIWDALRGDVGPRRHQRGARLHRADQRHLRPGAIWWHHHPGGLGGGEEWVCSQRGSLLWRSDEERPPLSLLIWEEFWIMGLRVTRKEADGPKSSVALSSDWTQNGMLEEFLWKRP